MTLHSQRCIKEEDFLILDSEIRSLFTSGILREDQWKMLKIINASHSSQQSERDKVLDELAEKVKTSWEFLFGILPYNDSVNKLKLLEWLEELRSKGGEQG